MKREDVKALLRQAYQVGSQGNLDAMRAIQYQLVQHLHEKETYVALQEAILDKVGLAAGVMRLAGYPSNRDALFQLFLLASEVNDDNGQAYYALQEMPPQIVASQAITLFMDYGISMSTWKDLVGEWIYMVQNLGEPFLHLCMPTLAWLLAHEDFWPIAGLEILDTFEVFTVIDPYHYFLPVFRVILEKSPDQRLLEITQHVLARFSPSIRDMYFPERQLPV